MCCPVSAAPPAAGCPAEHVMRALQQLGFDEWAAEVKASHEEFKEEAKSECGVYLSLWSIETGNVTQPFSIALGGPLPPMLLFLPAQPSYRVVKCDMHDVLAAATAAAAVLAGLCLCLSCRGAQVLQPQNQSRPGRAHGRAAGGWWATTGAAGASTISPLLLVGGVYVQCPGLDTSCCFAWSNSVGATCTSAFAQLTQHTNDMRLCCAAVACRSSCSAACLLRRVPAA